MIRRTLSQGRARQDRYYSFPEFKAGKKYAELSYKEVVQELRPINNDATPSIKGLDKPYPPKHLIDDSYRLEALKRLGK